MPAKDFQPFDRAAFMEYSRQQRSLNMGWRLGVFTLFYLGGMMLFVLPVQHLEQHPAWAWWWFPAFFAYLIGFPLIFQRCLVSRAKWEQQRRFRRCPSCSGPTQVTNAMVIIATGRCGYCGEVILSEVP
jgi:hypothetical protein